MNKELELYKEYCTGCGLCHSVKGVLFKKDNRGYNYPDLSEKELDFCNTVCPASGNALDNHTNGEIWGKVIKSYFGWSSNPKVRLKASSGGVITSICLYLIEKGIVDGIIHTKKNPSDPRLTITQVSTTTEEVLECMGSRYTASSPLMNILELIEPGKKYVFVGKPCDVSALRMFKQYQKDERVNQIVYQLSFFCAGQPSLDANNKLIQSLGCNSIDECSDLQYRGNGWPGFATVVKKDGSTNSMEYEKSWMKILGRDVRKICRFCADGTGEQADISCGDAWFLTAEDKPDFTEREGRNAIFSRTPEGDSLLMDVIKNGYIVVENLDIDKDKLAKSQPYHYTRKASLMCFKWALKICGRNFPKYSNKKLSQFSKGFPIKQKALRFFGTIERVINKKI